MAGDIADRLDREFGADATARAVFMGRVGAGPAAQSRSLRKPLEDLLVHPVATDQNERLSST